MDDGAEHLLCEHILRKTKSATIVQARYRRKINDISFPNRNHIFKPVKNFQAHGTCEDLKATGSSPSGPPITIRTPKSVTRIQESVVQQYLQLNDGHLEHVIYGSFKNVSSMLDTKWWLILKWLSFHLSINVIFVILSFLFLDLFPINLFK